MNYEIVSFVIHISEFIIYKNSVVQKANKHKE